MRKHICEQSLPSLPRVHLTVKRAIDQIKKTFAECYREPMSLLWQLEIEKQVWKNLLLAEHQSTKHPRTCPGGFSHHAWLFARRALRKLLSSQMDGRYPYYVFHFYVTAEFDVSFDFDCEHYL